MKELLFLTTGQVSTGVLLLFLLSLLFSETVWCEHTKPNELLVISGELVLYKVLST